MDTSAIIGVSLLGIVKWLGIVFTAIYLVFAFIVLRQVQLMTRALPSPLSPILIFIAIIHIGIVISVLILLVGVI